jgi:hypothetical protein
MDTLFNYQNVWKPNINAVVGGAGGGSYPAVRYYNLGPPPNKSGMKVTIHNKYQ